MHYEKANGTSLLIDIPSDAQQDFSIVLMSDVHFDSSICDLSLFYDDLKYAEKYQLPVFINGDSLDAMQGKYDPRRSPEDLKDAYKVNAYYDALVMDYADYLSKFDLPAIILGDGNHETSVLDHSGTDLLENVCYRLRVEHHKNAIHMGYWGYMEYRFAYKKGTASNKKLMYFHHGNGGSAPVTKSTIQINRQSAWLIHPDIVHNGHTHDAYCIPQPVEKYNDKSHKPYADNVWYIRTPGYKKSPTVSHRTRGFEAEKCRMNGPKSRGCYVLNLHYSHTDDTITTDVLHKIR
jgi:hypothetical protein